MKMKTNLFTLLITGSSLLGVAGAANAELLTFDTMPDGGGAVTLGTWLDWNPDGYLNSDYDGSEWDDDAAELFFNDTVSLNDFQLSSSTGGTATIVAYERIGTSFNVNEIWRQDVDLTDSWVTITANLAGVDRLSILKTSFTVNLDNVRINEDNPSAVSEPFSAALLSAGLLGLAGLRRRKK